MRKYLKVTNHDNKLLNRLLLLLYHSQDSILILGFLRPAIGAWPTCGLDPWLVTACSIWHHGGLMSEHENAWAQKIPGLIHLLSKNSPLAISCAWSMHTHKTDLRKKSAVSETSHGIGQAKNNPTGGLLAQSEHLPPDPSPGSRDSSPHWKVITTAELEQGTVLPALR